MVVFDVKFPGETTLGVAAYWAYGEIGTTPAVHVSLAAGGTPDMFRFAPAAPDRTLPVRSTDHESLTGRPVSLNVTVRPVPWNCRETTTVVLEAYGGEFPNSGTL